MDRKIFYIDFLEIGFKVYLCFWINILEKYIGSRKICYREVNIVVIV